MVCPSCGPADGILDIGYDSSIFVQQSIDRVFVTILEAIALVVFVIFLAVFAWSLRWPRDQVIESQMIGQTLWTEFFSNRDWPVASAIAIALLGLLLVPLLFYERLQQRSLEGGRT